jgi:hypothetical protein
LFPECPPKWKILLNLLTEIKTDYYSTKEKLRKEKSRIRPLLSEDNELFDNNDGLFPGRIMIIVRDELAMTQLKDVILHGTNYVMEQRFRWFITQQANEIKRKYRFTSSLTSSSSSSSLSKSGSIKVNVNKTNSMLSNEGNKASSLTTSTTRGINKMVNLVEKELIENMRGMDDDRDDDDGNDSLAIEKSVQEVLRENQILLEKEAQDEEETEEKQKEIKSPLSLEQLKLLPVELQLVLIQERILQLIPSCKSDQQKRFNKPAATSIIEAKEEENKKRSFLDLTSSESSSSSSGNYYYVDKDSEYVKRQKREHLNSSSSSSSLNDLVEDEDNPFKAHLLDPNLLVSFVTHSQFKENLCILSSIAPRYIIIYDSDVHIVRKIETYQSTLEYSVGEETVKDERTIKPIKVYFFNYGKLFFLF